MRMSSMPTIPCCRASKSSTRGFTIAAFGCRIPWPTMHPEACLSWAIAPSNLRPSICPPAAWCWRKTAQWHSQGMEPRLTLADAYEVQWSLRHRRLGAGSRVSGLKMGLTSRAKMKQMGVESPIYGFLLDEYCVAADSELPASQLIHPRVEPEIALVTRRELQGPGCTIASALAAVDFAVPALEVIDSRYADFKFDLPSVVADNGSSSR